MIENNVEARFNYNMSVKIVPRACNSGNNSDGYEVTLTAEEQPFVVGGDSAQEVKFTVIGNLEMACLINAFRVIGKKSFYDKWEMEYYESPLGVES